MQFRSLCLVAALFWSGAALAQSLPAGFGTGTTAKGPVLTDSRGMTLYVFDKDKDGQSACVDRCAEIWGPVKAADAAAVGDFSTILRSNGQRQWTYKGRPLYTYEKDLAPGDIQGDGFRDLWHLATP